MQSDHRFVVGIDLGTTNSAVSFVDLQDQSGPGKRIRLFKVPQLTGPGEVTRQRVLPSFLYIPGAYDIAKEAVSLSVDREDINFAGVYARDHGAKVPARLVSSAKSWLCHAGVDRRAKVLPWGTSDEVPKVSPVQATAAYLKHIRITWNRLQGEAEERHLENQMVILTVPASFDEVARDLTVEAAQMAGLRQVTLLEEPLAAFYSWLIRNETRWQNAVKPGELILICDVGGGTTDFTLITLREVDGHPRFERIAVGDHLILGGDNVDLALARRIEADLGKKTVSLSGDRWKTLCHQCREAKELILDQKTASKKITLIGQGSRLIAGTISAELTRETVVQTVLEGFFPLMSADTPQSPTVRKGITEFGLPYEPEPAITHHLGWFLERHKADVERFLPGRSHAPDLILFNGGSLKPDLIQQRIRAAIRAWFHQDQADTPRVLENNEPDLAVALGASYYGLVKMGQGVRVGSGSARSYYLGFATQARQGADLQPEKAVCLVERGMEEGNRITLDPHEFEVLTNQPVSFALYSSSFRSGDRSGDLVTVDDSLTPLPPLQTVIQYGKKDIQTAIPVQMAADYTEMGTLALWCHSRQTDHKWRLQFQLRKADAGTRVLDREVFDDQVVAEVVARVRGAFDENAAGENPGSLTKDIAAVVERSRENWPLSLIRRIGDELIALMDKRHLGPEYESRWLNLLGFCLRPGFGDGMDPVRVKKIWAAYKAGPVHDKHPQVKSEWWILWRRLAGGLKPGQQRQFSQDLTGLLMPGKSVKAKIRPQELIEIHMALANMELLRVNDKIRWGRYLLAELTPKKAKPQDFWSISRIGARMLLYGPVDRVIGPDEAGAWIEALLSENWRHPKAVAAAVAALARKTGDRMRDVQPEVVDAILKWLGRLDLPEDLRAESERCLKTVVTIEAGEQSTLFGEALPVGIVLKHPEGA